MAYSQDTLIERIRRRVDNRDWRTTITEPIATTTEATITVADGTMWAAGDIGEFAGGELIFVSSVAGNVLTVQRGHLASTPSTHADNAVLVKNPRITRDMAAESIATAISHLWPHVYTSEIVSITPDSNSHGYYSVDADIEWFSSATQESSSGNAVHRYGGRRSDHPIDLLTNLGDNVPVTGVTGKVVYIPVHHNFVNSIRVVGIRKVTDALSGASYTDFSDGTEADCILAFTIADLMESSDLDRTLNQDVDHGDVGVPAGRRSLVASEVWGQKGLLLRHQWEADLKIRLPLMRTYRQSRMV